jgi:hypothetical protein
LTGSNPLRADANEAKFRHLAPRRDNTERHDACRSEKRVNECRFLHNGRVEENYKFTSEVAEE